MSVISEQLEEPVQSIPLGSEIVDPPQRQKGEEGGVFCIRAHSCTTCLQSSLL